MFANCSVVLLLDSKHNMNISNHKLFSFMTHDLYVKEQHVQVPCNKTVISFVF